MPDRIIRESICTSDTLNELTDFEERFWHHLIVTCDDFGRFDARPAVLKARLFPLRESLTYKNVADCLAKLASVGLIELYEVDGRPFLHVVTWERYQRVRAKNSKFPAPGDSRHASAGNAHTYQNKILPQDARARTYDSTCRQMTSNVPVCESESECEMREANALNAPARVSAPTLEQVQEIAKLRGCLDLAGPFFDYYAAAGWRDSEGKPVFNWQQKFVAWQMREERQYKPKQEKKEPWSYDPGDTEGWSL